MSEYLDKIAASKNWEDYYDAHKAAYRAVLQEFWAFGALGFAQQLHHTAIPDVSGNVAGAMNWAVYSQPSVETLESFLGVFAELLLSEPQRVRSSRYLFFVTAGPPIARESAANILGALAGRIDYWCGSFDEVFSADRYKLGGLGLESLFGERRWLTDENCGPLTDPTCKTQDPLKAIRDVAHHEARSSNSVAPEAIRGALVDSSIILLGFQVGCTPERIAELLGAGAGVAAHIAADRARTSLWAGDVVLHCQKLLTRFPPAVEDYIVKPGDILSRIIREKYEMPYEKLWPLIRVLNADLRNPNLIFPGQRLKLPIFGTPGSA